MARMLSARHVQCNEKRRWDVFVDQWYRQQILLAESPP